MKRRSKRTGNYKRTHGMSGTRVYNIYNHMVARCYKAYSVSYKKYGARGVKVCDRWLESFETFLADMGEPPTPKHSLDRIDTYGNYEPSNCRWATATEQARNKRSNRHVLYRGQDFVLSDLCEQLGLRSSIVIKRLKRGWPVERAVETPVATRSQDLPRNIYRLSRPGLKRRYYVNKMVAGRRLRSNLMATVDEAEAWLRERTS